ncbi:MAG: bifunctional biotin--[acetyl-CoA-carboxylase] ligase/biotin operon repressor BirA [Gammaproteobacteria bacterium]|nr:bifunctional biotin--[acetyl-CoA-carboxylase] ligase/biotin operon repressor BirA [Gammaproteobacteria bacterium]
MSQLNNTLLKVTQLLSDGEYHDGTSIGEVLKITRAAVWKVIKKLEQYDIPLSCIKGKGYKLDTPLILLDPQKIISLVNEDRVDIEVLEKIDSTNQYLKTQLNNANRVKVCIAEMQTQGRGRLNRQWHSPFGKNIYLSLLYPFEKDISELAGLSLVVSLALGKTIDKIIGQREKMGIKWPNDLIIAGQKIAGILIEIQAESNGFCQAIIGIGVNVNMADIATEAISQPWSSLQKLTGEYYDRNSMCAELIRQLLIYLQGFALSGLNGFSSEWQQRDVLFGQAIEVTSGNHHHSGIAQGIDAQGHLLLKMADGSIKDFSAGDTTLRK